MVPTVQSEKLTPPYDDYRRNEAWDAYIEALSREGMFWCFNLDIQTLADHLSPLLGARGLEGMPARIRLFSRIVDTPPDTDELERFLHDFLADGDGEAAAAAVSAAVMAIWTSGWDFRRIDPWREKIDAMAGGKIHTPILARACLMGAKYMIEFAARGNWTRAAESGRQAMLWSRRAGSNNLRVYNGMMYSYACLWKTDPRRLESTLSDARTLCGLSDVSLVPKAIFQFIDGFYRLLSGNGADGREEPEKVAGHPDIEGLPDDPWFLGQFHFLHAAAARKDAAGAKRVAEALLGRGVDETRCYPAALHHFILGLARFVQGRIDEARRLARAALDFGRRSGAAAPEHHIRLLMAQIHSETGDDDAAMDLLEEWTGRWRDRGYHLYVVTAHLEIARIRLRRKDMEGARRAYDRAARRWVFGPTPHAMNRSRDFVREIRAALDRKSPGPAARKPGRSLGPAPDRIPAHAMGAPAVEIQTFGGLRIRMNGAVIDGDRWRGRKTKALLKALIVFGGSGVSSDRVMDALWPDADGDQAAKNLKVTLFRLRRLCCRKGETPLPWIRARNKRITLDPDLCRVDVFRFREWLARGMETEMDVDRLRNAIDLYSDDFLPGDRSADWIGEYRRRLRSEYADAAARLGERLLRMGRAEAAATALRSALENVGLDADLYALLIRAHLDLDQPSKARAVFDAAAEKFQAELGLDPDPKLFRIAREGGIL